MDSSASFNVAVKHLFRHLNDARVLRKNPIVRRFFEEISVVGVGRAREQAVLERIHQLVRQGADHCRDADLAGGNDEQALRQHTIVIHALEQRPVRDSAQALGLSCGHLYAERAEICRRVARYISEYDDAPALDFLPELDEFRVLMECAKRRTASSDREAAFEACDGLLRAAPGELQRIEAARVSALVSIHFGAWERTEQTLSDAKRQWAESFSLSPSLASDVAQACIDLIESRLADCRADGVENLRLAQRATALLERHQANAPARVRELYVESAAQLGISLWNIGDTDKGYEHFANAEASLHRLSGVSPQLRAELTIVLWKLRNNLLMSSKSWYPLSQRLNGLASAFELAYTSGFFFEAAAALVTLVECHAFAGDDAEALRLARFAVLLSKQQASKRINDEVAIEAALILLSTEYWEEGLTLLPPGLNTAMDSVHHELFKYFAAAHAFKLQRFDDAWRLVSDKGNAQNYPRLTAKRQLLAAAAAYELARPVDARRLIEAAIPIAEQLGSAPLLRDTYDLAAKVTGDIRFTRQASEVARLLTA